ncbi:hypothetical protein NTE_03523 [Candidatus Nitrososphaera evergladensis SR1]|uniref:YNCE-like beta-propeller domain-containing protein n=1 Tax=Candidatus Nitrososphaera evergladensis SR1 TaxID=1459636 RepID=A0A075MV75_9ARCH|nr:YncE family protein [Candidatus Nitrososphaera evergladensis]AIF85551.1 hypothetical protein NTE_03523 [Candidatus Nitrososphaera evergladensis SR1]
MADEAAESGGLLARRNLKARTFSGVSVVLLALSSLGIAFFSIPNDRMAANAHHVLDEIDVPGRPMRMSLAGDRLFVSNLGHNIVSVINTTTGHVIGNATVNTGVMAVEAVPEKNRLYIATFESGRIDVFALDSLKFLQGISLPGSQITFWYSPKHNFAEETTFLTGGWSMDYSPTNDMLYVANYNANLVTVIDTNTDKAVKSILVPDHPFIVKVDPVSKILLVASMASRSVTLVSTETNEIIDSVTTGCGPSGIAVDSQRSLAYITHRACFHIAVLDIATHKVVGQIPVGAIVDGITIDPSEHMLYASYMDKNSIIKIDSKTNEIISTIDMNDTVFDMVTDPATHNLYASTKFADKVLVIGPEAMATSLPVVTFETPVIVPGDIRVHGEDVTASDPMLHVVDKSLTMEVQSADGGDISIQIPRSMLDAQSEGADSKFQVLIDGKPVEYQQTASSSDSREITMFVPQGTHALTVTGTKAVIGFVQQQ